MINLLGQDEINGILCSEILNFVLYQFIITKYVWREAFRRHIFFEHIGKRFRDK